MRRRFFALLLLLPVCLSGCKGWMTGAYVSVEPHVEDYVQTDQPVAEVASTYEEMYALMNQLIEGGTSRATVDVSEYTDDLETDLRRVVSVVRQENPLAAYAVEKIDTAVAEVGVRHIATVEITYSKTQAQLREMKSAWGAAGITAQVEATLDQAEEKIVLEVNSYQQVDLQQIVDAYYEANLDKVMECPTVSSRVYPNRGTRRIIEIEFDYSNTRQRLLAMAGDVQAMLGSAAIYVWGLETDQSQIERLSAFLRPQVSREGTTNTPVYSLFFEGVGDDQSVAKVFKLLCQEVDVTCHVVSGTKNGAEYFWNIVEMDGVTCHLDLLDAWRLDAMVFRFDDEMTDYGWDAKDYPPCVRPEEPPVDPTEEEPGNDPGETTGDPDDTEPTERQTESTQPEPTEPEPTEPEETTPEDTTAPTEPTETQPGTEAP